MSNSHTHGGELVNTSDTSEYITVHIADQLFGISVPKVQDVFVPQQVTRVPLSMPEVAGVLNLRGRIVTVIDMRTRLGLPPREDDVTRMAVGVEYHGESYGLIIDSVGEVLQVRDADLERNPTNLDPRWQAVSIGVQRLEQKLMIILDVDRVLDLTRESKAA